MPPRSKQTDEPDTGLDTTSADDGAADAPAEEKVRLAVGFPHDEWNPGGDFGDLSITADGTEVPKDQEQDIRAAAKAAGVSIRKVG